MECQMLIERDLNSHKSDWCFALVFYMVNDLWFYFTMNKIFKTNGNRNGI